MQSTQSVTVGTSPLLSQDKKQTQDFVSLLSVSLLFVTLVWGSTVPVLKLAAASLSGVEISALRFVIAAACLLPWAMRASR